MDSIITTNLKDITLSSQFLTLKTPNVEIEVDIKKLLKEPVGSDNVYFNATPLAKAYDKKVINFLRLDGTADYMKQIEAHFKGDLESPLTKTVRGKYHSGTWLHKELFLEFISWCDPKIRFEFHQVVKSIITHSNELKIERANTKVHFKELADVIKDKWIPAQESDNAKKFAYSNIATLVNMAVFGTTSSKYASDNDIVIEKDKSIRDYLPNDLVQEIDRVEKEIWAYIFSGVTDYEILRERVLGE